MLIAWIGDFATDLFLQAKSYGVDPIFFIVLYFSTTPFILVPLYFLGRIAIKKTDKRYFYPLLSVFILAFLTPYIYILIFGVGISIYLKLAVIAFAAFMLFGYLDKKLNIKVGVVIRGWLSSLIKKK